MPLRVIRGSVYQPTTARSGSQGDSIFRMSNLIKRAGNNSESYWESSIGPQDLSETIANTALTGTIALTSGSNAVVGTGTAFKTELHLGQFFLVVDTTIHRSFLCVVERILSNTSLVMSKAYTFSGTVTGKIGYRLPVIQALDNQRATALRLSLVRYDKGTIFSVGDGEAKLDGASLPGSPLNLTRHPQVSILTGTNYTHAPLGLPDAAKPTVTSGTLSISAATNANPVSLTSANHGLTTGQRITISGATGSWTPINGTFTITRTGANTFTIPIDSSGFGALTGTVVAGGASGMQGAIYGILVTRERIETVGYGNPSEAVTVTVATGDLVSIDFGAMDGPSLQNAWGIWVTRYVDAQDTTGKNYLNGPWFRLMAGSGNNGQVIAADLTGTAIKTEWLDGEVEPNDKASFDNDAPPDAEFVDLFNIVPVWISCMGPGDTSPGIRVFPAKPSNVEAAPAGIAYPTAHGEIILGVVSAQGRLYLLTTNHLQVTVGTGNDQLPVVIQPFWKAGFINPFQLDFVNGVLYGCTTAGPSRSVGAGDEQEAEKIWASDLDEYIRNWTIGHILVKHDPILDAMCYIEAAHSLNSSGFWTSRIWCWELTQQEWTADLLFTSTTQDCIVSGVATVGNHLEFLMGGRLANDTVAVKTYRFEAGSGAAIPWSLSPQYSDGGVEDRPHIVKAVRVNGKLTGGAAKVYGSSPTQIIDVASLEAGTNSLVSIPITATASAAQGKRNQINVKNRSLSTVRIEGTYSGSGTVDRVDEIMLELEVSGARR